MYDVGERIQKVGRGIIDMRNIYPWMFHFAINNILLLLCATGLGNLSMKLNSKFRSAIILTLIVNDSHVL